MFKIWLMCLFLVFYDDFLSCFKTNFYTDDFLFVNEIKLIKTGRKT